MPILQNHIPMYKEVFALPDLLADPVLVFGYPDIHVHRLWARRWSELGARERWTKARRGLHRRWKVVRGRLHPDLEVPDEFLVADLPQLLKGRGITRVEVLDLFDPRATLSYDMNFPVPREELGRYATLLDIGCLEHVFDTKQCLENCFRMLRTGGHYFLHTPVRGYHGHGLHVFDPEALLGALALNGFELVYCRYSDNRGVPLADPGDGSEVLIWLVARKTRELDEFRPPQQGTWRDAYPEA